MKKFVILSEKKSEFAQFEINHVIQQLTETNQTKCRPLKPCEIQSAGQNLFHIVKKSDKTLCQT